MVSKHRLAEVAALLADPSRAAMLGALMDGRALPAGVLARAAGVTAATASGHVAKLAASGLVRVQAVGRHRYVRLASVDVAAALEALERLIPPRSRGALALSPEQRRLRAARLCYDHLAGELGVAVTSALVERKALTMSTDGLALGGRAAPVCTKLGVDLAVLRGGTRPLVRTCIDWTERREHVSGALGAAVASEWLERDWLRRERGVRALRVTERGRRGLWDVLGVKSE